MTQDLPDGWRLPGPALPGGSGASEGANGGRSSSHRGRDVNALRCRLRHFLASESGTIDTDQWNRPPPPSPVPPPPLLPPLWSPAARRPPAERSFSPPPPPQRSSPSRREDPSAPTRVHSMKWMYIEAI